MLVGLVGVLVIPGALVAHEARAETAFSPAPSPATAAPAPAPAWPGAVSPCAPQAAAPPVRSVEGVVVHSPAHTETQAPGLRLRTHVRPRDRVWIGPEVPAFVPLQAGKSALDMLDRQGTSYVATYREPFTSCGAGPKNCASEVRIFDCSGNAIVAAPLHPHLSRATQLEVQDVHYDGTTIYFNEACQTYSRDAGGRCSSLVALDPVAKRVLWRTPSLTSNNWFVVARDYIVAAYGFTSEPGSVRIVRKKDGAIMDAKRLDGINFEMFARGDTLSIEQYYTFGRIDFTMTGFDGPAPKLVRAPRAAPVTKAPAPARAPARAVDPWM